jgi:hypothetical protein
LAGNKCEMLTITSK